MSIKNRLRRIAVKTPEFVHRIATQEEIARLTKHLMTEEEVLRCEENSELKAEYVAQYHDRFPSHAKKISERIEKFVNHNASFCALNEAEFNQLKTDIAFCYYAYGTRVDEYVFMHYYDVLRSAVDRRNVVSDLEQHIIRLCANDLTHSELSDKASAFNILHEFYKRDVITIRGANDRTKFDSFVMNNPKFVLKRVYSSRGNGVELIDITDNPDQTFEFIISGGKALLEEVIEQSDPMARFNPDSVNTVRLATFLTRGGAVVPWGFFRTGRKGSFIDNCAAGGVFASINTKRGVTCSVGCDESGNRFDVHPDSGIPMKDFCFPDWEDALNLCKKAAEYTPSIKYLSWDLAHSTKYGWVIVEVNTSGQFMQQAGTLQGVKSELTAILDQMDLLAPYKWIRE